MAADAILGVTVMGRIVLGGHWFADWAGGLLPASGLALFCGAVVKRDTKK